MIPDWDELFERAIKKKWPEQVVMPHGIPSVHNGIYTLTLPDGGHRTFRISTQGERSSFAPGRRLISLLVGPDNTNDYESVAFLNDTGPEVWKRHRGHRVENWLAVLWRMSQGEQVTGYELLVARHCMWCNRVLTDSASIERGYGPTCWKRHQEG